MRKRIIIAFTLYVLYGLLLTYLLSFGRPIATSIINSVQNHISNRMHGVVEIEDVQMSLSTEDVYVVGKSYAPKYTVIGQYKTDAGLVFTALDDTVVVNSTGGFRGVRTEETVTEGRIRITSTRDSDFEKIITLRFEKKYPSTFDLKWLVKSVGYNAKKCYVGVPMYLYVSVPSGEAYSEKDFTIEFDPTYFELVGNNTLLPIRETPKGETVTVRYVYGNGDFRETTELRIYSEPDTESFDAVYFGKLNVEENTFLVGKTQVVYLYKDGKRVYSDFEIEADDTAGLKFSSSTKNPSFSKPGMHKITVRLPNGFSQTVTVHVKNEMAYPTVEGIGTDAPIKLSVLDKYTYSCSFPKGVTYQKLNFEYDKSMMSVTYQGKKLILEGKRVGETTLKVIVDDGDQHMEETYQVVIEDDHAWETFLWNRMPKFIKKGMGHMGGFCMLAFFSINLFCALALRRRLLRWSGYVCSGLFFALLTEFIQFFMPGRNCSLSDVGVDMIGFAIGTLVAMGCIALARWTVRYIRKKRTAPTDGDAVTENAESTESGAAV